MKGRWLAPAAALLVVAALAGQTHRFSQRVKASVALRRAETLSLEAARMGGPGHPILRQVLGLLARARQEDPAEVGIPIATGSVHLLLDDPRAAIEAYEVAQAMEPRPETYLNLGRAQLAAGDRKAARESFLRAVRLDFHYRRQVPEDLLPPQPPERPRSVRGKRERGTRPRPEP